MNHSRLALAALAVLAACDPAGRETIPTDPLAERAAPLLGDANDPYLLTAPATRTGIAANTNQSRYVRLTVPANHQGLRVAARASANIDLFLRRDGPTGGAVQAAYDKTQHTLFVAPADTQADDKWWIEVHADEATTIDVQVDATYARELTWDNGATLAGTATASTPTGAFGDHLYRITARAPLYGAWRNVLRVSSGEADLFLAQSSFPYDYSGYQSAQTGSDAFVFAGPEIAENQVWYLRVRARSASPAWTLLSGDIYVADFGPLAYDTAPRTLTMDVGGLAWFRTSATAQTLAWRLSANVPGTVFRVNDTAAPVPRYSSNTWDLMATDETLVVPDYLKAQGYLVAVSSTATSVTIDSRNHRVIDPLTLPNSTGDAFSFTASGTDDGGFGYVTYKVEVPVQQIAWQVTATPTSGEVDLYIGKGKVPSERDNDGLSEVDAVTDSISLVPPTLTNGTFYVTVRGEGPFAFTLTSGNPVITDLAFVDSKPNGAAFTDQVGWRYFIVDDIESQVGALGWILELAGHVPGTEIALRRNAVPGRWRYRDWQYGNDYTTEHVDHSSTRGFLERPNHPADIWYIGIYQPTTALGAFTLTTRTMEATPLDFNAGVATVTNHTSGRWRYYKTTVPADAAGWDLRLTDVTAGRPKMVVRAELVPGSFDNNPSCCPPIWGQDAWASGGQWAPGTDLTRRPYRWISDAVPAVDESGRNLLSGMSNPLRAGVFYIGISDTWTTPDGVAMSYTLRSRGIGTGASWSIPIQPLTFAGGTASATNLAPRDLRVYKVTVPANAKSFGLELAPTTGDAMMAIRKDHLPNQEASGSSDSTGQRTGARRQKNGLELFYRYPDYNQTVLPGGDYYVVVGAEGAVTAQDSYVRGGTTSFTLTSRGELPVEGDVELGETPLTFANQSLRYSEQKAYRFRVAPGLSAMEIRLVRKSGAPYFDVSRNLPYPTPSQAPYYAAEGGHSPIASDDDIVTLQGPDGTYTVLVTARSGPTPPYEVGATYDLIISPQGESTLAFNGGVAAVADQGSQTWRYFKVVVPEGALGWDLRLENIASGKPRMVIRRDQLPENFYTNPSCCPPLSGQGRWDTGWSWAPAGELTQRNYGFYDLATYTGGEDEYGRRVSMGLGSPLEPGTYYVGVSDAYQGTTGPPLSYELVSRGIGIGQDGSGAPWEIQVEDLDFAAGTVTRTLAPREHAYFRVVVPADTTSWDLELVPTLGEAMMAARKDALPNADATTGYSSLDGGAGTARKKTGPEFLYRLPDYDKTVIPAGTYYVGVGAEGQGAYSSSYIGRGDTTFTLTSKGEIDIAVAPEPLAEAIRWDDQTLRFGEQKVYRFEVPAGTKSMEVRLEGRTGAPYLTIGDDRIPTPTQYYPAALGGDSQITAAADIVTLTDPSGIYTVVVTAYAGNGEPDATYDLVVEAIGETPLAFNGGEVAVTDHATRTWRYFRVNVPPGALGWDLRLRDVTSGRPRLVIRRDDLPENVYTNPGCCPPLSGQGRWDSGWTWAPAGELTQRNYGFYDQTTYTGGADEGGRSVSMGMGTPLEPGTYIVGVTDLANPLDQTMRYRLVSRGIGVGEDAAGEPWSIQVRELPFGETVEVSDLPPREHVYYRLQIPDGLESWGAELEPVLGEVMMAVRRGGLPNAEAGGYASDDTNYKMGARRQKNGREWFYKLPWYDTRATATGDWYLAVGAEGQDAYSTSGYIGRGPSGFRLRTTGPIPVEGGTDVVVESAAHTFANQRVAWGEQKYYRVRVPPTVAAFEVRLDNRVGSPYFDTAVEPYFDPKLPSGTNYAYTSTEGGVYPDGQGEIADQIVGVTGDVTIGVHAYGGQQVENAYDLVVTPLPVKRLAWDGGEERVVLKDREVAYFQVEVPQDCDGVAQAGWIVSQDLVRGQVSVEVRKGYLPEHPTGNTQTLYTTARETIIVPPFLEPGSWYVAVRATGNSEAVIRTREVKEDRHWTMPRGSETASTPGLTHPFFGDTGVAPDGSPLINQGSGDQGVDLGEGRYRFYRVTVPTGNGGLIRTRLEAISGDPELYIRRGAAPTLIGMPGVYGSLVDYTDTRDGSSYGHWVPVDSRYGTELLPGEYWIAVYAQGSNVRYRMSLDVGVVQDLAQSGGSITGHALAAGDMRFYRVRVPQTSTTNAQSTPLDWTVTLTQQQGDALVMFREEVPPGLYSQVPTPSSGDYYLRDWNGDRSPWAYGLQSMPTLDATGPRTLSLPWLRPDTTYWIGVFARTDVVYDLASATSSQRQVLDGVYDWRTGRLDETLAAGASRLYRIDVPANAGRYRHDATVADGVKMHLSVGLIPPTNGYADWASQGYSYNADLDRNLDAPGGYIGNHPWVAGESYYLLVENTTTTSQRVQVAFDGRLFEDDSDNDGLSDGWEYRYYGALYYDAASDTDNDGLGAGEEETLDTDPTNRDSDRDDLDDGAELFAGGDPLKQDTDLDQVCDGSDSAPDDPNESGPVVRLVMHQWENGSYGKDHGTSVHETRLVAVFDRYSVKSHWLHLTGYDIEAADEVAVYLNGALLGHLPVGGNDAYSMPAVFFVDSDELLSGTDNRLELRQKTRGETWGVKDLGLFTFGQSFGYDGTRAYDTRHPEGFDIFWKGVPDALVELRAFDLDASDGAGELSVTANGQPFLSDFPTTADNGWTPYLQVPVLAEDLGAGVSTLRVRRTGGDGNWQLRLVECRPLTSTFGTEGNRGEGDHAVSGVEFMFPEKPELRELMVQYRVSEGEQVKTTSTLRPTSLWASQQYYTWSPNRFFFSEASAQDFVRFERVLGGGAPQYLTFVVGVRYYGPCADRDYNGVRDCEEVCDDLDEDGEFARTELCISGTDCDDANPEVGAAADDQDCDGVPTASDCDDSDPAKGSAEGDVDCDGIATELDCDDANPAVTSTREGDADCDQVPTELDCDDGDVAIGSRTDDADCDQVPTGSDCDDTDPQITATRDGDQDCDGVPTASDCDDNNPEVVATRDGDQDCDGVPTANDCDDANASVTTSNVGDQDCDGVPSASDCDDANPAITATNEGDLDCDGVPSALDCDDTSGAVTASRLGDADCDGRPTALDCDDTNPAVTSAPDANDRDCDGLPTPIDCDDRDAAETRSRVDDADCDDVIKGLDCDDEDPSVTRVTTGDLDCDLVPSAEDCDDRDASDTRSKVGDADCDGSPTGTDCDDQDPLVQSCPVCVDLDEDGHDARTPECPAGNDCDDGDGDSTTYDVDADCDGTPTEGDCDDEDEASPLVAEDADCDGAPTAEDCDDEDPLLGLRMDDADCDGVPSELDNCASEPNPDQLDSDVDGTGDACEDCLGEDGDGDFVVDMCDVCPTVIDDQRDSDGDGTGDACEDGDGDGRFDPVDNCPEAANADQADGDRDGIGDACDTTVVTKTSSESCGGGSLPPLVALALLVLAARALRRRA